MSSVTLYCGTFCHGEEVAQKTADSLGLELVQDQDIIQEVSQRLKMSEERIRSALSGRTSLFKRLSHDKDHVLAAMKLSVAEKLRQDRLVFFGFAGHLIPGDITHVLKVGLIAETKYRLRRAVQEKGLTHEQAVKRIRRDDEQAGSWIRDLFQKNTWDSTLYDMIIPMDKKSVDEAVDMIKEYVTKEVLQKTPLSEHSVEDFSLSVRVQSILAGEGKDITVSAKDGHVSLTINKHVVRLSRLKKKLRKQLMNMPDVKQVDTHVGPGYYKSDIYRKFEVDGPSKVVLVDDEREYAETLSERLLMRDMDANVVYDGREALSLLEKEEPEVMVLDLKMPGIDGLEVLRRVKEEHPKVEVIVMTGQGSESDKDKCLKLGAFAYLEKPVDVEVLAQIMRKAYQKARGEG